MANAGPNTNGSQFFITFVKCPWLDGKHVVFGQVAPESINVINNIHSSAASQDGKPKCKVVITDSGVLQ
jgi:cyclophilin family peptidyl-prolyl cis-trans isomerase